MRGRTQRFAFLTRQVCLMPVPPLQVQRTLRLRGTQSGKFVLVPQDQLPGAGAAVLCARCSQQQGTCPYVNGWPGRGEDRSEAASRPAFAAATRPCPVGICRQTEMEERRIQFSAELCSALLVPDTRLSVRAHVFQAFLLLLFIPANQLKTVDLAPERRLCLSALPLPLKRTAPEDHSFRACHNRPIASCDCPERYKRLPCLSRLKQVSSGNPQFRGQCAEPVSLTGRAPFSVRSRRQPSPAAFRQARKRPPGPSSILRIENSTL